MLVLVAMGTSPVWADVTRLRIERREVILNGKSWGAAGAYEKLIGKVDFALDPKLPQNQIIVDLDLAPKNAQGLVEFSADFYLIKPVDPARGNGRLFYQAGNRGTKTILPTFQNATSSADPATDAEFGNGALMNQGFTMLWMGWQWDVPQGRMRMDIPVATNNGQPITGWVRGNFIPGRTPPPRWWRIEATDRTRSSTPRAPRIGWWSVPFLPIRRPRFHAAAGASPMRARAR